ncbi:MAG TPA: aminopeptidase P family protein [Elusimicrobiota bacterium]|nr:aminopeptidase P family protein [Elusimicrobiota bacterium]
MSHYKTLRSALAKKLAGDALILLDGGKPVPRNFDVDYTFRQNSDFLYLTGVEEPGCHLVIDPRTRRETLFVPRIDSHHRVWEGHVPSPAEARVLFGVDRVMYADEMKRTVGRRKVVPKAKLRDALDDLRACKTVEELALMKRANDVSGSAHRAVMAAARPEMKEYHLQAVFEAECLRAGLKHLAYPSIVASGVNGAVLHYRHNNATLKDGDLFLIDAGAEDKGYAADITRTFPVNGKFSQRQRDVYSIVLETQKSCIERARPGIISADLHVHSMRKIAEGLRSLGLLRGDVDGLVEGGAVRLFYPHGLTHMLGLDVHDVTGGKRRVLPNPTKVPVRFIARLEPGFVITMEPGIYFIAALLQDKELRRKHKGSVDFAKAETFLDFGGVRIEDDIVIQDGPALNLTSVPKEIADVEAACER